MIPKMHECFEMCIVQSKFSISVLACLKHEPIARFYEWFWTKVGLGWSETRWWLGPYLQSVCGCTIEWQPVYRRGSFKHTLVTPPLPLMLVNNLQLCFTQPLFTTLVYWCVAPTINCVFKLKPSSYVTLQHSTKLCNYTPSWKMFSE